MKSKKVNIEKLIDELKPCMRCKFFRNEVTYNYCEKYQVVLTGNWIQMTCYEAKKRYGIICYRKLNKDDNDKTSN